MRFVVFLFFTFSFLQAQSQTGSANAKAIKLYTKAVSQITDGNLNEAIETLKKNNYC